MFIFGYPSKDGKGAVGVKETMKRFKVFIKKARVHSIQILKAFPITGTDLRKRLKKTGSLFPLSIVPWKYYDGNWIAFKPENMTVEEFQDIPLKIMKWFYSPFSFFRVCLRAVVFPIDYLVRGWKAWRDGWNRDAMKAYGSRLIRRWQGHKESKEFLENLKKN